MSSQNDVESVENVFDDIPDELIASIPEVTMSAAATEVPVSVNTTHVSATETLVPVTETHVSATKTPIVATETTQTNMPVAAPGPKMRNGPRMSNGPRMLNGPRMHNGPRMLNGPTVTNVVKLKNTIQKLKKRTSDRLRKLKTKAITGPGATADAPMVLDESEEGVLTQESTALGTKEGVVLPYMRTMPTLVAE